MNCDDTSGFNPNSSCTCGRPWHSVIPPPPCPVHGGVQYPAPQYPILPVAPVPATQLPDFWDELRAAIAKRYSAGDLLLEEAIVETRKLYSDTAEVFEGRF